MHYRNSLDRLLTGIAVTALVLGVSCRAAIAEEEESPNSGFVSLTFNNDFTTAYMFRGILQERDGLIWEPSVGISFNLYESEDGPLKGASFAVGNWNSVHSEDTGANGSGPASMYESDFYPSLSLSWAGGVTTALTYYFYTSPNGAFRTVEEVDLAISFDDSPYLGAFALKPSATFAFETKRTSFGSGSDNVAVLAIGPSTSATIPGLDSYPITVTLPVSVGLSMDDYYDDGVHNDTFGYATIGLNANIPLAFVPAKYGSWSITNGFNVFFLSDALEAVNQSDEVYPVWTSSIAMAY